MNNITKIKESIFSFLSKVAEQRHLIALRDGMLASIPIILVGSTFLLLGSQWEVINKYFPTIANSNFGQWYSANQGNILIPFRFTMGMLSVYVAFSIACSLAKSYNMPILPQGMGAVACFFLTMKPVNIPIIPNGRPELLIKLRPLGGDGLFLAIICGLLTVEISRLVMNLWDKISKKENCKDNKESQDKENSIECEDKEDSKNSENCKDNKENQDKENSIECKDKEDSKNSENCKDNKESQDKENSIECKDKEDSKNSENYKDNKESQDNIPPAVAEAFMSFLPLLIVIFLVWAISYLFNIDIYSSLITMMKPLEQMGDTVYCVVVVNIFMHIFGFAGLHGISVINGVFFALWQKFLLMNTEMHAMNLGAVLPTITAYPFYQWFIWVGGAGTTLPIPFMLLFSKNKHLKNVGKISLIPSLFNVNEPLIFGIPIVANPIFLIPFILAPTCCGIISFFAFQMNLVYRPFIEVPWVLPAFFGAPLCCQDLRALILLAINMTVSAFIWLPFLKAYEKKLSESRKKSDEK